MANFQRKNIITKVTGVCNFFSCNLCLIVKKNVKLSFISRFNYRYDINILTYFQICPYLKINFFKVQINEHFNTFSIFFTKKN